MSRASESRQSLPFNKVDTGHSQDFANCFARIGLVIHDQHLLFHLVGIEATKDAPGTTALISSVPHILGSVDAGIFLRGAAYVSACQAIPKSDGRSVFERERQKAVAVMQLNFVQMLARWASTVLLFIHREDEDACRLLFVCGRPPT